jgi:hypothetical protein
MTIRGRTSSLRWCAFLDKVVEHRLGDLEVCDNTLLHRFDHRDLAGCAAQHFFGLFANCLHFTRVGVDGNRRRLVHNDPPALGKDPRTGRT